jgi:hypothetical protein
MTVAWTDPAAVQAALGPSVAFVGDPLAPVVCDAANAWAHRRRAEAGYTDDPADGAPAPSPDVAYGTTLYAVALWRERQSTDSFASFGDMGAIPVAGTSPRIRQLLGIGRGRVDTAMSAADARSRRRAVLFPPTVNPVIR